MNSADWKEPPLTCPAIDVFIADQNPPQSVVDQLGEIRDINSQLRFGTWVLKAELATKDAEIARMRGYLKQIKLIGGNLSDDVLCTATGANDARQRGGLVCLARDLARAALKETR